MIISILDHRYENTGNQLIKLIWSNLSHQSTLNSDHLPANTTILRSDVNYNNLKIPVNIYYLSTMVAVLGCAGVVYYTKFTPKEGNFFSPWGVSKLFVKQTES